MMHTNRQNKAIHGKQKMETHFLKFVFVILLIRNKLRITKKIDV